MGDDFEEDFAVDGEGAPGGERAAEVSLDHREDGLDLPALRVGLFGKALPKLFAIAPLDGVRASVKAGSATDVRWDDARDAEFLAAVDVHALVFVAGVGQEGPEAVARERLIDRALELRVVAPGPAVDDG